MEDVDQFLQQLEGDPELQAIKARLSTLEAQIKNIVSEEIWQYLLEWEESWAHYVTHCIQRLHPASIHAETNPVPDQNQ